MAGSSSIGSLVYKIIGDTSSLVGSLTVTKREMGELKRVAADTGGAVAKMAATDFPQLTRLSRDASLGLKVTSERFGQLAASSREARKAARDHIAAMRASANQLANGGAFGKVSVANQRRIDALRRSADEFEKQIGVQTRVIEQEKKLERQEKETAKAIKAKTKALKDAKAADKAHRRGAVRKGQAQAAKEEAIALGKVKAIVQASLTPTQRLAQQSALLRKAHSEGKITALEFSRGQKYLSLQLRINKLDTELLTIAEKLLALQQNKAGLSARAQAAAMAALRKEAVLLKAQLDILKGNIGSVGSKASATTGKVKALTTAMMGLVKQLILIHIAYKAMTFAIDAVKKSLEIGRSTKAFEIFTGSRDEANRLVGELRNLAATTPLVVSSTLQATRTMLQYGVESKVVVERLRQLGDISGGSHEQLQRLALAFGQITANGRLQGQELRQLVEAGFNPLAVMAKTTGKNMFELRDMMADGAVTAQMVGDALQYATGSAGRFNNQMERVAKETAFGKIQVALGQLELAAVDVAEKWAESFGDIAQIVGDVLKLLNERNTRLKEAETGTTSAEKELWKQMQATEQKRLDNAGLFAKGVKLDTKRLRDEWAVRVMALRAYDASVKEGEDEKEEADKKSAALLEQRIAAIDVIRQGYRDANKELEFGAKAVKRMKEDEQIRQQLVGLKPEDQAAALADIKALREKNDLLEKEAELKKEQEKADKKALKDAEDRAKKIVDDYKKAQKLLADRIKKQKEETIANLELKKQLIEIAKLRRMGVIDEGLAVARRGQLLKEFHDKQEGEREKKKDDSAATTKAVTSGSREEYQLLAKMLSNKDRQKDIAEETHRKREKAHFDAMEAQTKAIVDGLSDIALETVE